MLSVADERHSSIGGGGGGGCRLARRSGDASPLKNRWNWRSSGPRANNRPSPMVFAVLGGARGDRGTVCIRACRVLRNGFEHTRYRAHGRAPVAIFFFFSGTFGPNTCQPPHIASSFPNHTTPPSNLPHDPRRSNVNGPFPRERPRLIDPRRTIQICSAADDLLGLAGWRINSGSSLPPVRLGHPISSIAISTTQTSHRILQFLCVLTGPPGHEEGLSTRM